MSMYAVTGGTLWGNRGAEAMVTTTIGRIRERDPGATFVVFSYFPDHDRALVTDPAVQVVDARPVQTLVHGVFGLVDTVARRLGRRLPDRLMPRPVRTLQACRALFDVSGISFHDGRLAVVAYNVMCLWPAMLLGVPVVRLSQAMGPFRHPLNRLPARWMTRQAVHTYARGGHTAAHMRALGVPNDSWSIAPDVAFAYQPGDSRTTENDDAVGQLHTRLSAVNDQGRAVVGLVPSSLVWSKTSAEGGDYVALLATVVTALHQRGIHVLVMPNATRASSESLRNNDIAVIRELRNRLDADPGIDTSALSWVDFDLNTASIRALVGSCTVLITSRFHAMVAALALGVPPLVMGWSHKYDEVLEMFGCADLAVDFTVAERDLIPLLDHLLAEHSAVRERILAELPAVTAAAVAQFDVVEKLDD